MSPKVCQEVSAETRTQPFYYKPKKEKLSINMQVFVKQNVLHLSKCVWTSWELFLKVKQKKKLNLFSKE